MSEGCHTLTKQMEECMDRVSTFLPEILKEKYRSLIKKIENSAKLSLDTINLLSTVWHYLFDPEEGYVLLASEITTISNAIKETVAIKSEFPKDFLPLVDKMEKYLTKPQQLIDEMRDGIEEMMKVGKFFIHLIEGHLPMYRSV